MRLSRQTDAMEGGKVHIPVQAHWLEAYLHELMVFPKGRYDDQVDSTSQALDWMRYGNAADGWIEYYRQMSEEATRAEIPSVRARHTSPGHTLYTQPGRRPPREPDGSFLLTQAEWLPLANVLGWSRDN